MLETPVLIVGGGPVGLTASILLSQQGIRSLLVERHPGTAILPKARGINGSRFRREAFLLKREGE
jgi:putative polyketide hydroxylase